MVSLSLSLSVFRLSVDVDVEQRVCRPPSCNRRSVDESLKSDYSRSVSLFLLGKLQLSLSLSV